MKTLYLIVLSLFLFEISGFAQSVFPLMPKYYQPIDSSVTANKEKKEKPQEKTLMKQHEKFSYSVTVGTGYSSFGNNMSMMSSYVSPSINYQVNSKLNITVNGMIMQNNMNGMEKFYGVTPGYSYNSSPTNYGISGTMYYQLSDRWSIFGDGAYFENQSVLNNYSAQMYNTDLKTISIGVGYKVNDKINFNLKYRYSNGLTTYNNYMSPFYNNIYSPYQNGSNYWRY